MPARWPGCSGTSFIRLVPERGCDAAMTRLLSVTPFPPRLDASHGGGRATAQLLTRLAERMPVALLCLQGAGEPPVDETLVARCDLVRVIERPHRPVAAVRRRVRLGQAMLRGLPLWAEELRAPALHSALAETAREWRPDVAQLEFGVMAQYLPSLPHELPTIVVIHEPGSVRAHEALRPGVAGRAVGALDRLAWRRFEPDALARADRLVVFTERDYAVVAAATGGEGLRLIPLGFDTSTAALDPAGSGATIVFVGSFVHSPNVDAARFFVNEILPRVLVGHPRAVAFVVGDAPPRAVRELAREGVVVTGRVDSVEPYLERAAVVVAPLRVGGGMRVKVLEALAAGKALVATPLAVSGLDVVDGVHVLVRDGADPFADAISSLLSSREAREALGRAGRAWADEQPGWEATADEYEQLYDSLLEA